jgi:hypothetical protein
MRLRIIPMPRFRFIGTALIAMALPSCAAQSARPANSTAPVSSLCELPATSVPLGTVVSFQAIASTDFHHGITLMDPACPSTAVRVGRAADGADQSVERFLNQLRSLAPHLTWRSARGSFTGRITRNASGNQHVALLAAYDFQEVAHVP